MARGLAVGAGGAAALAALRFGGVLEGPLALAVAVATLLLVPVSREFSRRLTIVALLVLGWMIVPWLLPLGEAAGVGRTTVLWIALTGALAGWVAASPEPARRLRLLMPRVRTIDGAPIVTGLVGAYAWRDLLTTDDPVLAMGIFSRGWDHVAHFGMYFLIRLNGTTTDLIGAPPDGARWETTDYPQGYHTALASITEIMSGSRAGTVDQEVVRYLNAMGVLAVVSAVLAVAAVCSLPGVRRRLSVASLPAVALVGAAWVVGPGATIVADAFPNLLLTASIVAGILCLVVTLDRLARPAMAGAIAGGLVGVAHGWIPLLTLAVPAALCGLLPLRRARLVPSRWRWALVGIGVLTLVSCLHAVIQVTGVEVADIVEAGGGITVPSLPSAVASALAALGAAAIFAGTLRGSRRPVALRSSAAAGAVLSGLALVAVFAAVQIARTGTVSYYFWKYLVALWLVSLVVLAVVAAEWWRVPIRRLRRPAAGLAGSAVLALAVTQIHGVTLPDIAGGALAPRAPMLERRQLPIVAEPYANVLAAARTAAQRDDRSEFYVALDRPAAPPLLGHMWYQVLTGRWTTADRGDYRTVDRLMDPDDVPGAVRRLLATPGRSILTPPADREAMCAAVGGDPDLCGRIRTW